MSWVPGADGSLFPIQNLPYGIFSHAPSGRDPRPGVAIGDMVLDLRAAANEGLMDGLPFAAETVFGGSTLNAFMETPHTAWAAVRARLVALLSKSSDAALRENKELQSRCLVRLAEVQMHLPAAIGDYTDFYSSREHATNVGIMFRGKDNALQPNWLHLPVGYHGRASSVVVSGTPVVRPKGQLQLDKTDATKGSQHEACRLLDFELEMVSAPRPSGRREHPPPRKRLPAASAFSARTSRPSPSTCRQRAPRCPGLLPRRPRRPARRARHDGRRRPPHLRLRAVQRLVRPRRPEVRVRAARPLRREEFRHHDLAVGGAAGAPRRPPPCLRCAGPGRYLLRCVLRAASPSAEAGP